MKRIKLLLLSAFVCFGMYNAMAQTKVSGQVTSSEDGQPIPGVSILVKGLSGVGTSTNIDGKYSLNVPAAGKTLVFSYVGYKSQEVALDGKTSINVVLLSEARRIDEVVVTALGIKRDSKALGYSVQSVGSKELTRTSNADVVNSIGSRTAGVQVTSSGGTAGASAYMTIRGAHSLTGNNQPLFVVDGVPVSSGGGMGAVDGVATSNRSIDLNPEDIETMSVLKGGAATALYGLQASNGAIVITTKRGSEKNKMAINISQSISYDVVSQLPARQNTFTQGLNGAWASGNAASWGQRIDESRYDNSNILTPGSYIWDVNGRIVNKNNPNATDRLVKVYDPYDFFQKGSTYNTNVSVSGGNDVSNYYFSVGNMDQTGIVPKNTFGKTSLRLNAETKLTSKLTTGGSASYINSRGNFIQQGSNTSGVMLGLLRTPPTFDNSAGYKFEDGTQRNYRNGAGYDNPYWTSNMNSYSDKVDRFMGNAFLKYEPLSWMTISCKVGTDWYAQRTNDRVAVYSRVAPAGYNTERFSVNKIFNSDLLLSMKQTVGGVYNFNLTLGQNMYSNFSKSLTGKAVGLTIPEFYHVSNTGSQTAGSITTEYRTAAFFGDFSFDYAGMVFLGLTGRNDWSTTMPSDRLSSFYPSASFGFIFSELPGLKGNSLLSFGKLRASWAKTANIASPYNTRNYYGAATVADGWTDGISFPFNSTSGYTVSDVMVDPKLKHETQLSTEIGVDLRFLKNRIRLDVAYFINENKDLLLQVPIPSSSGFTNKYTNAASMESKGIEIMLSATPIQIKDFTWDISANFTKTKNNVIKLAEGVDNLFLGGFEDPQIRAVAGMEYRTIFGYDWYRDASGKPIIYDGSNPNVDWPVGTPITDLREMKALGTVNPDWIANFTNTFSYKGLSLVVNVDIKHGGKMYNGTKYAMNYFGTSAETATRENKPENRIVWDGVMGTIDDNGKPVVTGGVNTTAVIKDQDWYRYYGGSNFAQGPTANAIEDGGWVRLREVTISYVLPKSIFAKTMIKGSEFFATGKNLWLNTKYTGIDPETNLEGSSNAQGMDYFNMPGTKSYTFGIKLSF